jgi:hypothetical protein
MAPRLNPHKQPAMEHPAKYDLPKHPELEHFLQNQQNQLRTALELRRTRRFQTTEHSRARSAEPVVSQPRLEAGSAQCF